jgi:pyruvate formate lyase activating enzyme
MDRRLFLRCLGCGAAATALSQTDLLPEFLGGVQNACAFSTTSRLSDHEARFYTRLDGGGIRCELCPRHCVVTDLERGYCGVRENRSDTYHTLVYGLPCAANVDPIEKKPLFHFYPGTDAFSLATAGCNCNCKFCQNWDISQSRPEHTQNIQLSPESAVRFCVERGVPTIAYTYSEPIVFYEYMYDIAEIGRKKSVRSVMITGGYIEKEPLAQLLPHIDAVKVDLKAVREAYYRDVVRAELQPVLDGLIQIKESGVWLEIVYLVVPTLNDSFDELRDLARWIKTNLGADTPVHFSRFYPQYLLENLPPTPRKTLEQAYEISRAEGLNFVYLGNLRGHPAESTYCPSCGKLLIERQGYRIGQYLLKGNKCPDCERVIPGLF